MEKINWVKYEHELINIVVLVFKYKFVEINILCYINYW